MISFILIISDIPLWRTVCNICLNVVMQQNLQELGLFVEGMTEEQILSEKLSGPAVIGADFERIFLLDKKNSYVGAKIRWVVLLPQI